jgi:hypothetical protein
MQKSLSSDTGSLDEDALDPPPVTLSFSGWGLEGVFKAKQPPNRSFQPVSE